MIMDCEAVCPVRRCPNKWADNDGGAWCYGCEVVEVTNYERIQQAKSVEDLVFFIVKNGSKFKMKPDKLKEWLEKEWIA